MNCAQRAEITHRPQGAHPRKRKTCPRDVPKCANTRSQRRFAHGTVPPFRPKATITDENPAGTDGFEFVEFAHPEPEELRTLFTRMGYRLTAKHKTRAVELWQQGDISYLINAEPDTHAARFIAEHGPCAPSMGWRVVDAQHAHDHAVKGRHAL